MITFISYPNATKDNKRMRIYWRHIKYYLLFITLLISMEMNDLQAHNDLYP